jgi:hypothetical protein
MYMSDVMANLVTQEDSSNVSFTRLENLNTYEVYNLSISANLHPAKWWTCILYSNTFYDHYYGAVQGGDYSGTLITTMFNTTNMFSFKKQWNAELGFFYRSKNLNGVLIELPISGLDIGLSKSFADGKGNVSLNVSDILWTTYQNDYMRYQNVNAELSGRNDSRRVRLSISWRFGKSEYERSDKRKTSEEEMRRVKG